MSCHHYHLDLGSMAKTVPDWVRVWGEQICVLAWKRYTPRCKLQAGFSSGIATDWITTKYSRSPSLLVHS